jgi:hypothetical protein
MANRCRVVLSSTGVHTVLIKHMVTTCNSPKIITSHTTNIIDNSIPVAKGNDIMDFNVKMPIWRESIVQIHAMECEEVRWECEHESPAVAYQRFFFSGVVLQIQLRTEGRQNGDLGAVAPYSGVPLNMQMGETRIISLLRMYFPRNWEFGSALSKLRNSRGGTPQTPPRHATDLQHRISRPLW